MDTIAPIEQSGKEAQAGEEVAGEFVVACGDGAEVLEPAAGALDHLIQGIRDCHVAAVLAASICHFGTLRIGEAKTYLATHGLAVRM
jgi:imidazole glycerol phosphate synthase subunit HisF